MLLSHLPLQSEWQLVARPLRRGEFERIVAVVSGGVWTPLTRAGRSVPRLHGEVIAADGPFYGVGRTDSTQPYQTLLLYHGN